MKKPVVAIIGRPNVGKSTLFNKLAGKRISIVDDTPGVTRDRVYAEAEWLDRPFIVIDTGGIEKNVNDPIVSKMTRQAEIAIDTADVIVMLADVTVGVTADDHAVADKLKKSKKPVVLCVNKVDSIGEPPSELYEFYNLGLGDPFPVSSLHGHGTGDLLDEIFSHLPSREAEKEAEEEGIITVAIIGKPNAGKSSLVNRVLEEDRMIVSDVAGTTRDAVDNLIETPWGKFNLIDTAGIRKQSKIEENIEKYSIIRAYSAIDRADVAVLMIDATEGPSEQDTKIVGYAHNAGKATVIAVNKWDIVEDKDSYTMNKQLNEIKKEFSFMDYVETVFISAKTGQRIDKLFKTVSLANAENQKRIATGVLNEFLADCTERTEPPSDKGKRLKIYYMTQTGVRPPSFSFFVNSKELFHFSYQRYIENRLREVFGFKGTPIVFNVRTRGEKFEL